MPDWRQHHAGTGGEALDVATDLVDVLVAARDPEAAPGLGVEDRALLAELRIGLGAARTHGVVVVIEGRCALVDCRHRRTSRSEHGRDANVAHGAHLGRPGDLPIRPPPQAAG